MPSPTIYISNHSTVLTDAEVKAALPAFRKQIKRDWAPSAWGTSAKLMWIGTKPKPIANAWELHVFDDSDQAGALGYHDLTATADPLIKVFAKTAIVHGFTWTEVASHEIVEALGNSHVNQMIGPLLGYLGRPTFLAFESSDPVEADTYVIDGVTVSNFVYPSYFEPEGDAPYDYLSLVKAPFEIRPGGYQIIFDGQFHQIYASGTVHGSHAHEDVESPRATLIKLPAAARKRSVV